MNRMKNILLASAAIIIMAGCTKDLEQKISQLESTVEMFKSGVGTLKKAVDEGLTVETFTVVDGGYKIILSDGSRLYLYEASAQDKADAEGGVLCSSIEIGAGGNVLYVTVTDGTVYELFVGGFNIVFSSFSYKGNYREVVEVPYTLTGVKDGDDVVVRVLSSDNCIAEVDMDAMKINVTIGGGESYVDIYVMNRTTDKIKTATLNFTADGNERIEPGRDEPWGGYLDPDVYDEQDIINLTNVLRSNIYSHNLATAHIMEIAYNFWKRRDEFIYSGDTALDKPWNYWSYVGYTDSGNTGFTVGEGHGGYKRIDCSTFVRYVVNGIDYYSTPYYNALEWTEVKQGALTNGVETASSDVKVCRSGKMYLRTGKKYILESAKSSYSFTKIYAYDRNDKVVKNLSGATSFTLSDNVSYIRVEMKVSSASNYAPAVKGVSSAAILKCLRIREDERLPVNAEIPLEGLRSTFQICPWLDQNGYGLEAYKDYNPLSWEDSDFLPGTIIFMGQNNNSRYKGITHIVLYIGGGYIIHSQGARGLLGGEGIMIDKLRDMEYRYTRPFCSAAVVKYHTDYSEEKGLLGL